MYTLGSLIGALLFTTALLLLIGFNFRWYYQHPLTRHLLWFHGGSVGLALFLIVRLYRISLLDLWRKAFYEQVGWVALGGALIAYAMAFIFYKTQPPRQEKEPQPQFTLESIFRAMEDNVFIYDSDFQLTALTKEVPALMEKETMGHLREYLTQFASEIPLEQQALLQRFFQHQKPHESLTQFKWLSHDLKSYVVLSKVLDKGGDWVGTVMLMHPAEEELALMESMEGQNQQRHDMNQQLEASLHKLAQFGYEEEKDRLLQEINQSILEGTRQAIRSIQAVEKDDKMTLEDKQKAIAGISQRVSDVYKHLRQTVRQMAMKSQGEKHD